MKTVAMVFVWLLAWGLVFAEDESNSSIGPQTPAQTTEGTQLDIQEIVKKANELFEAKDKTKAERVHIVRDYLKSLEIRWIDIDLTKQKLECWEKDKKVRSMPISAGKGKIYSRFEVAQGKKTSHNHVGIFRIYQKSSKHWSRLFKVWMNHNLFYHEGHAIHDCRHRDLPKLGRPASHGCIRTPPKQNPYNWANIGDIVFCHE